MKLGIGVFLMLFSLGSILISSKWFVQSPEEKVQQAKNKEDETRLLNRQKIMERHSTLTEES